MKRFVVAIRGMHCQACASAVEDAFLKIPGIRKASVDLAQGVARIEAGEAPDREALDVAVRNEGYELVSFGPDTGATVDSGRKSLYLQLSGAILAVIAVLFVLSRLHWLPQNVSLPDGAGYGIVFAIGLLASVSTCIAVTGGLLVALAAKYDERAPHLSPRARFATHLYFNTGRVVSYTAFGALIGFAGSALTLSPAVYGIVTIAVSAIMFLLGLQMLGLMPLSLRLRMPGFLRGWIAGLIEKGSAPAAFGLGGLTFFLPCGFTQALQLYVLAKADAATGALTMLVFSLGTLPVLLGISAASSFSAGNFRRYFFRFAGAAVVLLSIASVQQGLVLLDLWPDRNVAAKAEQVPLADGKQIVRMKVVGLEYLPNRFTVVEGVPVEWQIDAQEAEGCGRVLVIPKLRLQRLLSNKTTTVISFTPGTAEKSPSTAAWA
jgi:sulfite exporter TauE/SafE/copper chaperone CopZ